MPCSKCGTLGGLTRPGLKNPERIRGMCCMCYARANREANKLGQSIAVAAPVEKKVAEILVAKVNRHRPPTREEIAAECAKIRSEPGWRSKGDFQGRGHDYRIYRVHIPAPMTRGIQ